jgi:hypothetical protein
MTKSSIFFLDLSSCEPVKKKTNNHAQKKEE